MVGDMDFRYFWRHHAGCRQWMNVTARRSFRIRPEAEVFRGVRYGVTTAAANRFRAPQPPNPWTGLFDAGKDGRGQCPQRQISGTGALPMLTEQPYHRTDRATMLIDTQWRMENDPQDWARELWSSILASESVA